jgi:hypothetical protein
MKRLILWCLMLPSVLLAQDVQQISGALKSQLANDGYGMKQGEYFFLKDEHEDELYATVGNAFGVNPGSPYGTYLLPPGDGEPSVPYDKWSGFFRAIGRTQSIGKSPIWRLRRDEAVVFVGYTPPNGKYFGFLNSVIANPNGKSPGNKFPFHDTDTDLPVNPRSVGFSQLVAVITTSHQSLAEDLKVRLVGLGVSEDKIFYQRISTEGSLLTTGYEENASTFMTKNRVAYCSDASYVDSPVASVFRVAPLVPISNPDTFPKLVQPRLSDGFNEDHLQVAQQALANAVAAYHARPSRKISLVQDFRAPLETGICLEQTLPCLGTIDTLYNFSLVQTLGGSVDDFTAVVGVFHTATKKATYTSVTIYDAATGASVQSATDDKMIDSVKPYLSFVAPGYRSLVEKHQATLYVHRFARICDSTDKCSVVPTTGPVGTSIAAGAKYNLYERGYLNQRGNHGAAFQEVLAPLRVNSQRIP